jgi:hypothetical protein
MKTHYVMIGLWVALSMVLLPLFLPLLNADGTSYISIANQYWRGNWAQAVNGFWGPLLSWLLIPFLAAGVAPVTAAKIVLLLAGIPMILALRRIAAELDLGEPLTTLLLIAAIPIGVYMALCMITPDFLVAVILLVYLAVFLRSGFPRSLAEGASCGLLGALAYWAKPFAFFFFLAHFLGFSFVRLWFRRKGPERRRFLAAVLAGAAVFAVLSGTWIGIISHKYGRPLINSSSRVNWSYLRPGSPGQPIMTQGFLPPPNKIAISAWEDPTLIPVTDWSPLQSSRDFVYYLGLVKGNMTNLYRSLADFFPLAPLVLLGGAVVAIFRSFGRRASPRAIKIGMLTLTLALYSAGYALVLVEERYIWIDWYLVLLILGGLIAAIPWTNRWKVWGRAVLAVVLFGAFLVLPIRFFGQSRTISASDTRMPAREIYEIAKILKSRFGVVGSTASNRNWNEMLFITTFNHGQYFGQMRPTWSSAELESALLRFRIRYFFLWRNNDPLFDFLNDYIEVTRGGIPGLKVFLMKKKSTSRIGETAGEREGVQRVSTIRISALDIFKVRRWWPIKFKSSCNTVASLSMFCNFGLLKRSRRATSSASIGVPTGTVNRKRAGAISISLSQGICLKALFGPTTIRDSPGAISTSSTGLNRFGSLPITAAVTLTTARVRSGSIAASWSRMRTGSVMVTA